MMIVSSPAPALKTSIPPLPVRVSLPAPATKISSLLVTVLVRVSGKTNAGKSYVIFGKTDTDAVDLSKLGDESKYTIDYRRH
jgi:hypothetical protein